MTHQALALLVALAQGPIPRDIDGRDCSDYDVLQVDNSTNPVGECATIPDCDTAGNAVQRDVTTGAWTCVTLSQSLAFVFDVSKPGGSTPDTSWDAVTDAVAYSDRWTVSDQACVAWSNGTACGGVNCEARLRDVTNGATVLTVTADCSSTFTAQVDCSDPAESMPASAAALRWEVRYSGTCGGTITPTGNFSWEVH